MNGNQHQCLADDLLQLRADVMDLLGNHPIRPVSRAVGRFQRALDHLRYELAQQAVRDGADGRVYWRTGTPRHLPHDARCQGGMTRKPSEGAERATSGGKAGG